MRVVLVNLESAIERRARMTAQLDALGIVYERVGCDFRHRTRREIEAWFGATFPSVRPSSFSLSGAELGCWASHLTAWSRIARSGSPAGAVIEDDVRLDDSFPDVVATLTCDMGPFDVVYLGTSTRTLSGRRARRIGRLAVHAPIGLVVNTWGYVVRAAWIARVLAHPPFTLSMPIDHFLGGRGRGAKPRVGVLEPACVVEDPATAPHSQIEPHTWRVDRLRLVEAGRRRFLASRAGDWMHRFYRLL